MIRTNDPHELRVRLRALLRPNDHIVLSQGAAEPLPLIAALDEVRDAADGGALLLTTRFSDAVHAGMADHLRLRGLGGMGSNRPLARVGLVQVLPLHLSQLPQLMRRGELRVDVTFVQVAPADATGTHSLGIDASYTRAAMSVSRVVVAEVNAQMPSTGGHPRVPTEAFDLVLDTDRPLIEVDLPAASAIERAIGRRVATYVENGATLQVGIGSAPRAVVEHLSERRGLSIHTGLLDEALFSLVGSGVVAAPGSTEVPSVVAGTLAGSHAFYRAAAEAGVELREAEHTHGLAVLAARPRFTAINGAVEIDVSGQVNAEMVGGHSIGAVGGLGDFVRGAMLSVGGRSVFALPATARDGRRSRIVGSLDDGVVTVPRSDVDVVVTEYGAASLRGCTEAQRAARLIRIAHPAHRAGLEASLARRQRRPLDR